MTRYFCGAAVFAILITLFTSSVGWCSVQQANQGVLANSKIKNRFKNGIVKRIKKILPKYLKKCSIEVIDIAFLQREYKYPSIAEEWTVEVCKERKVYFVADESPKGEYYTITPKEERLAREKEIWDAVKNEDDDGEWRATLFYIDELEAMSQGDK